MSGNRIWTLLVSWLGTAIKQTSDDVVGVEWPEKEEEQCVKKNECAYLVRKNLKYIVFLDHEFEVDWLFDEKRVGPISRQKLDEVLFQAARVECIPSDKQDEKTRTNFKRMVGEAIAFALEGSFQVALGMLREAERYIYERNLELSRYWTLRASALTAAFFCLIGLRLWTQRAGMAAVLGGQTSLDLIVCFCAGSLGALLSIIMRIGSTFTDCNAGSRLHWLEGILKVTAGCVSGLIAAIMVQLGLILPNITDEKSRLLAMLLLSVVAGASERFAPSMIAKIEGEAGLDSGKKKIPGPPPLTVKTNDVSETSLPSRAVVPDKQRPKRLMVRVNPSDRRKKTIQNQGNRQKTKERHE